MMRCLLHCDVLLTFFLTTFTLPANVCHGYVVGRTASPFKVKQKTFEYKGHEVSYEMGDLQSDGNYGIQDESVRSKEKPILLLNGFGVSSKHQHRLIPNLQSQDEPRTVYCMDYIGQGHSWPKDGNVQGVDYSADSWVNQTIAFIENIVLPNHNSSDGGKIHLVGHSVGGYLSVVLATRRPDLIESICLLDPTPIWGLNLPGWDAQLPAPSIPKQIGKWILDLIGNRNVVKNCLEQAYASPKAISQDLVEEIVVCASGAESAISSVMWSEPARFKTASRDFYEGLANTCCDVLLVFGKNDPWCRPCFAKKMLEALSRRGTEKVHRYVELGNVGHCPNHEAPRAVGQALRSWVGAVNRKIEHLRLVLGEEQIVKEPWADITMREMGMDEIPMNWIDLIMTGLM